MNFSVRMQPYLEAKRRRVKDHKVEQVKEYFASHLGCHAKEASRELGIPYNTMRDYLSVIRAEWRG